MGAAALAVTGLRRGDIALFGPIVIFSSLVFLFVLGEMKRYPFSGKHFVQYRMAYYFVIAIIIAVAGWIERESPPGWYPTPDHLWMDVFIFSYALAAIARGLRVYSSREWPWPMSYVAGKNARE